MTIRIVILAAGKGKRMGGSDRPKVLHTLLGKTMLSYVLDAVVDSAVDTRPVIVVGHMAEHVKTVCGDACDYVLQSELKGTGDAVARTRETLEGSVDHVMVLNGDQPFVSGVTLRKIADRHLASGAAMTLGTTVIDDFEGWRAPFSDFGRVTRDMDGSVTGIVEAKDADELQLKSLEVNPSIYCFKAEWLWKSLKTLTNLNAQGEYYVTDLLAKAVSTGEEVISVPVPEAEALGINTLEQLAIAERMMSEKK